MLNFILYEGLVKEVKTEGEGLLIRISQLVGGIMESEFLLFVASPLSKEERLKNLTKGDTIIIQGGILYKKNNEARIRVSQENEIRIIPSSYYIGEIDADNFI